VTAGGLDEVVEEVLGLADLGVQLGDLVLQRGLLLRVGRGAELALQLSHLGVVGGHHAPGYFAPRRSQEFQADDVSAEKMARKRQQRHGRSRRFRARAAVGARSRAGALLPIARVTPRSRWY
jgi:hypothetical protein